MMDTGKGCLLQKPQNDDKINFCSKGEIIESKFLAKYFSARDKRLIERITGKTYCGFHA
jgi:hypothetical protein